MAAPVYATQSDYREWSGQSDVEVASTLLRRASEVVDEVLIGAVYAVDSNEKPTETVIGDALRDATCAQVEHFLAIGDRNGSGASPGEWSSVKIGSVSLSGKKATASAGTTTSGISIGSLTVRPLRLAGLISHGVTAYG